MDTRISDNVLIIGLPLAIIVTIAITAIWPGSYLPILFGGFMVSGLALPFLIAYWLRQYRGKGKKPSRE